MRRKADKMSEYRTVTDADSFPPQQKCWETAVCLLVDRSATLAPNHVALACRERPHLSPIDSLFAAEVSP